jgi:hypothetical protein
MIWGAFSADRKFNIEFITNKMNSENYQAVLERRLVPFLNQSPNQNFIFQQDNASIHNSRGTKIWFSSKNIPLLEWPALSPDLNPIENVWGLIVRDFYANNKQYSLIEELKCSILRAWDNLSQDTLQNLVNRIE